MKGVPDIKLGVVFGVINEFNSYCSMRGLLGGEAESNDIGNDLLARLPLKIIKNR